MQTLGLIIGYFCAGSLVLGALFLIYEWLFSRKPVYEQRGWYPEGRVLRREDRSIVYEGDHDNGFLVPAPIAARNRMRSR